MLLSVVVVGVFSAAAFAIAPMGPPMAPLPQGQFAVAAGYAYSDMNLEVSGPLTGLPQHSTAVLYDVQSNVYYGAVVYGIADDWNIFGAAGTADAEFPGDNTTPNFEGGSDFAFAIGCKRTLAKDEESGTVWGTVFQYFRGSSDDVVTTVSGGGTTWGNGAISLPSDSRAEAEVKWYELQLAAGPTIPVCDGVCLYGGPFLHLLEGDVEVKYASTRDEYEAEQNLELGAYIGAQVELGRPDALLGVEFLWTGEVWGVGVGATILCP